MADFFPPINLYKTQIDNLPGVSVSFRKATVSQMLCYFCDEHVFAIKDSLPISSFGLKLEQLRFRKHVP